jgi:hypothetical protein
VKGVVDISADDGRLPTSMLLPESSLIPVVPQGANQVVIFSESNFIMKIKLHKHTNT